MSNRKAILRSLALALVLATGFAVVYGFLVGWLGEVWERLREKTVVMEYIDVRYDGQPLIHRAVAYRGGQTDSYKSLDGAEVPPTTDRQIGAALIVPREREFGEFPVDASRRVRVFYGGGSQDENWFFVWDGQHEGHGYFVSFDKKSKLCIGYIGRHGACTARPAQEDCFPVAGVGLADMWSGPCAMFPSGASYNGYGTMYVGYFAPEKIHLISGNQLLQVDLLKRSVATMIDSADLVSLGTAEPKASKAPASAEIRQTLMAVRTADHVLLFDPSGKQQSTFTIPADLRTINFTFYDLDNENALLSIEGDEFVWIDASGNILKRKKVTLENSRRDEGPAKATMLAAIAPAPIMIGVGVAISAAEDAFQGQSSNYSAALRKTLSWVWPALLAVSILSLVLAWLCYRRQRRFAQTYTIAWVTFVLIFGLPGLVGYLVYRRWPVREACPACQAVAPRDRDACAACGKEFPAPKPQGIEVFA
jgi:hypothetical protein